MPVVLNVILPRNDFRDFYVLFRTNNWASRNTNNILGIHTNVNMNRNTFISLARDQGEMRKHAGCRYGAGKAQDPSILSYEPEVKGETGNHPGRIDGSDTVEQYQQMEK